MTWSISGNYLAGCSCVMVCGCAVDAKPRDAQGGEQCLGMVGFHVAEGRLDEVDLSGVDFALYNHFPSNLTSGDWKVGIVVDEGAKDEQAAAVERIVSGREGGTFGEIAQFFGEYLGMERASVSLTNGDKPRLAVGGKSDLEFEPLTGADGNPTTVKNAMFGFAPEFVLSRASGRSDAFGLSFDAVYGEKADFAFSSEQPEGAPAGRA
ncbi:DUF1326 domain-containing protein [Streptomyces sp. H27-D2]|uniref:DUF1326 domain-containing protein n=1 Tax=Streptomyces sp. H27-D2 TaxID=3046304 RepID=UPI002DB76B30|nr:DUF1326 domain-containing protein [Streptomyces sp. H27-D2]MEC4016533.1 DUF1326 domain-containing protein [Streptomyces sp. H27-D2]